MPVIVLKKLTLTVTHFQGRRIVCDACGSPFTYLARGEVEGKDLGLPVLSSDERMAMRALPEALDRLVTVARAEKRGVGLCPHCRRYQQFMVANSRGRRGLIGLPVGLVLAMVLFAVLDANLEAELPGEIHLAIGIAVTVAVSLVAAATGLRRGPHDDSLAPESLTDGELDRLLEDPRIREGADPVLLWADRVWPGASREGFPVGLGFTDRTGERDRFGRFDTERALTRIEEDGP